MVHDRDVFSFELNESLYFEKEHEVSEMVGISLDPEISIQTYNDYVSIRGVIELQGEYIKADTSFSHDESTLNFEDYQSRRYLERIEDAGNGRAIFSHRFPIEISVPLYRVANLNDVTVSIESFDYEILENNQLNLKSTIDIYGISQESEDTNEIARDEADPVQSLEESIDVQLEDTFEFDIKEERKADQLDEPKNEKLSKREADTNTKDENHQDKSDRWKAKKTQSFAEFFNNQGETDEQKNQTENHEDEDDKDVVELEELSESIQGDYEEAADEVEPRLHGMIEDTEPHVDMESSDTPEHDGDDEELLSDPEDVRYLADMFREEEDDNQYAQMRLCIVQNKDTIETIAKRYEITPTQILKQNRLEDEELLEGQLLYIPVNNK